MKPIYLLAVAIAVCNTTYAQEHRAKYQTIWGKDRKHLNLSIPFVNYIYSVPPGEPAYEQTGLFGFSIGAGFCKSENRFQSFRAGVTSAMLPVERFPDSTGWNYAEAALSFFVNVQQNHVWKRIDVGYGPLLSYQGLRYGKYNDELDIDSSKRHSNWGLGASVTAYFRIAYCFYAGLLYQPQLFSLSGNFKPKYEHMLSVDFLFRLDRRKEGHPG